MKNLLEFWLKTNLSIQQKSFMFYVNNTPLSDLKALDLVFLSCDNKSGRLSLVHVDNLKVKIYSCFSPAQTNLRLRLDSLNVEQTLYFPR